MSPSYFDNNATTALAPEVLETMLPYLREHYGNPSSPHGFARKPAMAVAKAREQVAALVDVPPASIVFTSGGTESNALAIHAALAAQPARKEVVFTAVEHVSVLGWQKRLMERGYRVHVVPVNRDGALNLDHLKSLLSDKVALVSVMLANNETGIMYPLQQIANLAHAAGARVHTDAAQAAGKISMSLSGLGVDYATICGHKFHAMKGIGALYLRDNHCLSPMMAGGEQEGGIRPGTEPVALMVSLGVAAELARNKPSATAPLRDEFEAWLAQKSPGVIIAGQNQPRLPNTTLALFPDIETEPLLALLDMNGIACSSGSACASGAHEPSHVLAAMGLDTLNAATVRISASRYTTAEDYARLREALRRALGQLSEQRNPVAKLPLHADRIRLD